MAPAHAVAATAKRLMNELAAIRAAETVDAEGRCRQDFRVEPLEDQLLEWHFSLRGPPDGGFRGGRYHGRIVFSPAYPYTPPDILFLHPSGRFEVNRKICLSITSFHTDTWRPSWGVATILTAIRSFFSTPGAGAVAAIDATPASRARLARASRRFVCPTCRMDHAHLFTSDGDGDGDGDPVTDAAGDSLPAPTPVLLSTTPAAAAADGSPALSTPAVVGTATPAPADAGVPGSPRAAAADADAAADATSRISAAAAEEEAAAAVAASPALLAAAAASAAAAAADAVSPATPPAGQRSPSSPGWPPAPAAPAPPAADLAALRTRVQYLDHLIALLVGVVLYTYLKVKA